MKAIIEFTDKQNSDVEKVLGDFINEGWSEKKDTLTIAEIDVPKEKIDEIVCYGVKVNTDTPKVISLLRKTAEANGDSDFEFHSEDTDNISISDQNDEWGWITVENGQVFFLHGNAEPSIAVNSEDLPKWISAYLTGFDEFDEICPIFEDTEYW